MNTAFLSLTYCGPVQWYQKLFRYERCFIEQHENFIKQTYRNRCVIASANGPLTLSVPIEKNEDRNAQGKTLIRDLRISDHDNWRHVHWNALVSAYNDSAFFEYYADDLRPFYERKWRFLFDFNMEITHKLCELLNIEPNISLTSSFELTPQGDDFREGIRPKKPAPDAMFSPKSYYQVYEHKHGFLPNMSVLDLLFNEGNEAILYL